MNQISNNKGLNILLTKYMKHITLFENFFNGGQIDDLERALHKTPSEKFDLIVNIKGMEPVLHKIGLLGVRGDDATEEQLQRLFRAVDNKIYYHRLPVSYFFDVPERLPKNTKLLHFTNYADEIAEGGFTRGTSDLNKLGMSWGSRTNSGPGWNYAFPKDYIDYAYGSLDRALKHWNRNQVVEFEAEALLAFHYGDGVYQALFWGPSAKNIKRIR